MLAVRDSSAPLETTAPAVIPVILCFDVEPDEREVALEPRPWLGFERLLDRTGRLREGLATVTGRPVHFNWFLRMDPQIAESHGHAGWAGERYRDQLEALRTAGDVIGLHPHCSRWSGQRAGWVAEHADPDWVDHCIRLSFETYQEVFGEPCRVVRFGDRFLTGRALRLTAQLGARIDLTVEPGMPGVRSLARGSVATGRIPSHAGAPREPYRPSWNDPVRRAGNENGAGSMGMWMVPLTAIDSGSLVPLWRRIGRRIRRPRRSRYGTAALATPWRGENFWRVVEGELGSSQWPYLAFATRTDTFIRPLRTAEFDDKLTALALWPLARRLSFVTPDVVVAAREGGRKTAGDGV